MQGTGSLVCGPGAVAAWHAPPGGAEAGWAVDEFEQRLRAGGHRVTRPRRAVWQALREADDHVTADEVADALSPDVNVASVYRSLALLEAVGLARRSSLGDGEAQRWEPSHPDEHFHLVCESCGEVSHHAGDVVARVSEHLDTEHDFHVRQVDLVVRGTCRACRGR